MQKGTLSGIQYQSQPVEHPVGAGEVLGVLEGGALYPVEIDPRVDISGPVRPSLPCVVVGIALEAPTAAAPAGVDVALCVSGDAIPAGWVAVENPEVELERVATNIDRFPQAAVLLTQVLRLGETIGTEEALLVESLAYSVAQGGAEFATWLSRRSPSGRDTAGRDTAGRDKVGRDTMGRDTGVQSGPADAVLVERRDDTLEIVLNRPEVRNALNIEMRDGLVEALGVARADPSVTRIELRGAGPDFSAGGDLYEFGTSDSPVTGHLVRTSRNPARLTASVAERLTVHLHGSCIGAGIELASFANRVTARADTRIRLPELTLGLLPGSGGTVSIPRRIGRHRCAWLGLSGAVIDATRAAEWGLVDEVL